MLTNEKELSDLREALDKYQPLDDYQLGVLNNDIRVEHVWSSNTLKGNQLTRFETEEIINRGIVAEKAYVKDVLEALDLAQAYDYVVNLASRNVPLSQDVIKDISKIMLSKSNPEWGGRYRTVEVRPADSEFNPYAEASGIERKMNDLIDWANTAKDILHPVQYAADLHFKFVTIHPFRDGNGRVARLLMNLALLEKGYPVVNIKPNNKSEYLNTLISCQKQCDSTAFEELIARYSKRALEKQLSILKLNEKNVLDAQRQTNLTKEKLENFSKGQN